MDDRVIREQFKMMERRFEDMQKWQAAAAAERQKAEAEKHKGEAIEVLTTILGATFDKVSAYTSLIVIGGYAAFFTIWGSVEQFVSPRVRLWTFGFLGVSVLLFVLTETYRLTKFTIHQKRMLGSLQNVPAHDFKARHADTLRCTVQNKIRFIYVLTHKT